MAPWTSYRLSDTIGSRNNNFDLLRLIAALAVMFGHSFVLQPVRGRVEPILRLTGGIEYSGSLAVYTFFLISGMLITASYARQRSAGKFIALRFGRIYPALFACVFLTAFVVYPALSTLGFSASFLSADALRYFGMNATLFHGMIWTLPGIFEGNALKSMVNASLWTLPVEIACYVAVLIAGLLGAFRSRLTLLSACAIIAAILFWLIAYPPNSAALQALMHKPYGYSFYPPAFFLAGMILYAVRDRIAISWPALAVLVLAYAVIGGQSCLYALLIYGVLWLASSRFLHRLRPRHDLSYGVYLWAFPVQQCVESHFPLMDNLTSLLISAPVTLVVAAVSWFVIERPCIELSRRLAGRFRYGLEPQVQH